MILQERLQDIIDLGEKKESFHNLGKNKKIAKFTPKAIIDSILKFLMICLLLATV